MLKIYRHNYFIRFQKTPGEFYGPVLRGGLGIHLKKFLRPNHYEEIFDTPTDTQIMKRYPQAPKGYVLDLPFIANQQTSLGIVLFGKANQYAEAFRQALGLVAEKNKFELFYEGVEPKTCQVRRGYQGHFRIEFETPACVIYKGRLWKKPEFHILVRNLLRRIFLLGYYHYDVLLPLDFRGLIQEAEKIELLTHNTETIEIRRFSTRKGRQMSLVGLRGWGLYKGKLSPFLLSVLELGQLIHVGKHTVMGFGKIRLKEESA